jgi:predicted dehydrogenase
LPVRLKGIATATGLSATAAAKKFGFECCTTDYQQILNDREIDAVIIATRNNLHAKITIEALEAGKDVFVEKPLATNMNELLAVKEAYEKYGGRVMVGFNRRYSPYARKMKEFFSSRTTPLMMHYRVNAGAIPEEHWVHDSEQGAGMLVSEVCHFVDFLQYIVSSKPVSVCAEAPKSEASNFNRLDNLQITISYEDGSIGTISYSTSGNSGYSKELIELFGNASAGSILDFREINLVNSKEKYHKKTFFTQEKGIFNELEEFIKNSPVDVHEMIDTHLVLLLARTSLEMNKKIFLGDL